MKKGNKYKWDKVSLVLDGKEVKNITSINFEDKGKSPITSRVIPFTVQNKLQFIGILKNAGIELVFGADHNKAIAYKQTGNFSVVDENEIAYFASSVTKEEWDKGIFPEE